MIKGSNKETKREHIRGGELILNIRNNILSYFNSDGYRENYSPYTIF